MIRTICATALCGAILFTAAPAYAEELPGSTPASPPSARQVNVSSNIRMVSLQVGAREQISATLTAEAADGTRTPSPAVRATTTPTATEPTTPAAPVTPPLTASQTITAAQALTATSPVTASESLTLPVATPTTALTATTAATTTGAVTTTGTVTSTGAGLDPALDDQYDEVLEGTIIANRTEANVRFFVEGQVYDLSPLRAIGLPLPRPTAVLNLFNCDARQSESDAGCFWDPYLLTQEGFYEVVTGAEAGSLVSLSLREAGAPPANQIWVQNRTGERESILVNNEIVEIAPASVEQFAFAGEEAVVVHLRNCITQGLQTACEWAPQGVEPGYYYALIKLTTTGANNMTVSTAKLEGVVASSGEVVERPPQASCLLRVPTLNVRGGPGLEFPVVTKVHSTEEQPGSVVVVGFDASKQWMQVTDRIAPGGWVTSNPDFIICTGDMAALPVAGGAVADAAGDDLAVATPEEQAAAATEEAAVLTPIEEIAAAPITEEATETAPLEAAPVETAPEAAAEAAPDAAAETTEAAPEATPAPAGIPTGLARIVVNNGFDQIVRFTLDQQYRAETSNLSGEWDLQPGQSVSILVYPGMIPFTVSTPWQGLADNADVTVEADQERPLWLYFIPDPDGSGDWILQF